MLIFVKFQINFSLLFNPIKVVYSKKLSICTSVNLIHPLHQTILSFSLPRYHINNLSLDCYQSPDCYCSAFYNYSRLISDLLFYKDYYQFLFQHISLTNRTYVYHYSYRNSQQHPSPCQDYLSKQHIVGHFAELEYTWGRPLLMKESNYTNEQVQLSRQLIQYWSNFINQGQPDNKWQTITNLTDAFYMHIHLNETELKPLSLPSNIDFWTQTCPTNEHFDYFDFLFVVLFSLLLF